MDPVPPRPWCGTRSRPRRRGDGPGRRHSVNGLSPQTPQARGWTIGDRPSWSASRPRRRGDGPSGVPLPGSTPKQTPQARGWTLLQPLPEDPLRADPAGAGMDPIHATLGTLYLRRPRRRGDGPLFVIPVLALPEQTPQARGWTGAVHHPVVLPEADPADAGMDPYTVLPGRNKPGQTPRMRGWTRCPRLSLGCADPADAGMDRGRTQCGRKCPCRPRG